MAADVVISAAGGIAGRCLARGVVEQNENACIIKPPSESKTNEENKRVGSNRAGFFGKSRSGVYMNGSLPASDPRPPILRPGEKVGRGAI